MNNHPAMLHVERTSDSSTLRWVCRRPDLHDTPSPPVDSTLGVLFATGRISDVSISEGSVLVRFNHPADLADPELVDEVDRAVRSALQREGWIGHTGVSSVTIRSIHEDMSGLADD